MEKLLNYIGSSCSFLFSEYGFRIIDSHSWRDFGNALVVLKRSPLILRFINERDQILLEIGTENEKNEFYDIDLVRRFIAGTSDNTVEMTLSNTSFLKDRIEEIIQAFSTKEISVLKSELNGLKHIRSKELFPRKRNRNID